MNKTQSPPGRQRRRQRQRGTTVVEFALVFPLFMTVLFGVIEYGWIFYQRFNIANAVRDGVRQGVTVAKEASPDPRTFAIQKTQADLAAGMVFWLELICWRQPTIARYH